MPILQLASGSFHRYFEDIYTRGNIKLLDKILGIVEPEALIIAEIFYREMLSEPHAAKYLSLEMVETKLKSSMAKWIVNLVSVNTGRHIEEYMEYQATVGKVHARISIPEELVITGMFVIKRELTKIICSSSVLDSDEQRDAVIIINKLIDVSISAINKSYIKETLDHQHQRQNLKVYANTHHMAIECERFKSNLLEWANEVLSMLYRRSSKHLPSILRSEIGLWVNHKASLIFSDNPQLANLKRVIEKLESELGYMETDLQNGKDVDIREFNHLVTETGWILTAFIQEIMRLDSSRDVLTRLFNRRYLPSILQYETEYSLRTGDPYALLFVDVDHFKNINDTMGHETGDQVLQHVADILLSSIRSSDYVFRYGGEEFLMVIVNTNHEKLVNQAERIRTAIQNNDKLRVAANTDTPVTVSIGISIHDCHPDYEKTLKRADEALYEAKETGRNKCVMIR